MHSYDFRCKACQHRFTLTYRTYADYEQATPACPQCGAQALARIISRVNIKAPERDYTRMSSAEMLSVFESGDSKAVGQMFDQVAKGAPQMGAHYHEATQRLLRGESMDSVERDLRASAPPPADKPAVPPPAPDQGTKPGK